MKIVFRADASAEIGIGHVMRCLTLADELARLGGVCLFLCRELRGHMAGTIRDRGHKALLLPDTDDLAEDAAFTRQAVEREPVLAAGAANAALGVQPAFADPVTNLAFRLGAVNLTIAAYDMVFH